jgi:hypothetical protein
MHTFFTRSLVLVLSVVLLAPMVLFAQGRIGSVKGTITDSINSKPLANATINVLDASDSSLVSFARSRENGSFEVTKLNAGNFILMVTYTGFSKEARAFSISAEAPTKDFGSLPMVSNSTLDGVTVLAAPVQIKGDTVEFNAGSFKVNKPNAVVEDLLKRLPGVEVDKDGNIKANGQDVRRVLVDGKEFFGTDPKLATRNLQADMVNKVQVFDRKSDQSQFTGFDDGNVEPTINLTLKEDKRNGVFGRVSGGGGTDERYQANANINKFQKGEQLSFIGQANNINQQGFSIMDALSFSGSSLGGGGGGRGGMPNLGSSGVTIQGFNNNQQQGITTTQAAGLNYNNFKNSKLDFTSSYFFNGTQLRNDFVTRRETAVADSFQIYAEPGSSGRNNNNHRINMGIDWKIDSFNSLKITPTVSYQTTETFNTKTFATTGIKGTLLSDGLNRSDNTSEGYNLNVNALYRHRFKRAGRTFSTEFRVGNNQSEAEGSQFTVNNSFSGPAAGRRDTLDQQNFTDAQTFNFGVTARYTEPMSRRSLLEFSLFHNQSSSERDQRTFNLNKLNGEYDIPNQRLTNLFDNDYYTTGSGLKFRENRDGWNYTVGADLQRAELQSLVQGKTDPITQTFFNVLPNAQVQIGKNRYRNFRLFYNGNTQNPSVTQLQPIEDISDPLNITRGNPELKQSFTNNFRINYNTFDPFTFKSFFIFANVRHSINAIVNSDSLFTNGARLTTFDNVNGVYTANLNGNIGLPIKFGETRANLNLGSGISYGSNKNILNGDENTINSLNLTQRVSASYMFKELFDINIGGNINWNKVTYSLQAAQNTDYLSFGADLDLNFYLPKGFTIGNTVAYTGNAGRAEGFNPNFTLWNAYIAKSLLKNKRGEVRVTAYDLLNQNTGLDRTANGNFVQDTRYLVLKQYFMMTFTYNLSKFGNIGGGRGQGPRMMMMGMPR